MNARPILARLVNDTFRQSIATGIFWLMLAVSVVTAAVCLTVHVSRDDAGQARVEMLSGSLAFDVPHPRADPVRTLQLQLAGWVADSAGLILALIWTAGFLPSFLDPSAASVLLVKPPPRWILVAGKFTGVVLFIAFQTTAFVGLTWLALGVSTGSWDARYFVSVPLLVTNFAVFYSFSAMLAVATRSTVACAFGSIAFWLICAAVNFARHAGHLAAGLTGAVPTLRNVVDFMYWLLPKPLDFHLCLMESLDAENLFSSFLNVGRLAELGLWHPAASVAASVLFGAAILVVTGYDFLTRDY